MAMANPPDSPCASYMDTLPTEILLHVFSSLPLPDLICGARLTCWRWYHLSKDASLWTSVDLSVIRCPSDETDARRIRNGVRALLHDTQASLEHLTFSNISVDGGVYELFGSAWKRKNKAKFENLKSLNYSFSDVSPRNLRVALTTHPDITELYLTHTKISFSQAMEEAIHLPNLRKLEYHDNIWDNFMNEQLDEEDRFMNKLNVMKVPKHCPLLQVVKLHTIRADLDDEVIQQFIKFCANLKSLSFTWSTSLTAGAFMTVNTCSQAITELGLVDRQETGPYLNFVLPNFPHLLQLTVSGQNVYLEDCVAIGECCPKLRELAFEINGIGSSGGMFEYYLQSGNSLCGLELQKIAQKCKDLRKLHAPYSNIDDASVIFLSEQCLYLEDINFTQCHRLSKESIFALSKNSHCLKKVNFQDCLIDHKYVLSLVTKCRELEEVLFDHKCLQESSPLDVSVSSSCHCNDTQTRATPDDDLNLSHSQSDDIPYIDMTSSVEEYDLQQALLKSFSKEDGGDEGPSDSVIDRSLRKALESPSENPERILVQWNHCHIKMLSLRNSFTKEQYLKDLFMKCPDLTYISLEGSLDLTDAVVTTIAKSCTRLRSLNISYAAKHRSNSKFGDGGLYALIKYCRNLEVLSILHNHNITSEGLTALFHALDSSLRSLRSVSLCVGQGYACPVSVVVLHGLKYLTEKSKQQLRDAASTTRGHSFMLMHLDFIRRRLGT